MPLAKDALHVGFECQQCHKLCDEPLRWHNLTDERPICMPCKRHNWELNVHRKQNEGQQMKQIAEEQRATIVRTPRYIVWINDDRPQTLINEREVNSVVHSALMVTGEVNIKIKKVTV